jgi:hypothetical protein
VPLTNGNTHGKDLRASFVIKYTSHTPPICITSQRYKWPQVAPTRRKAPVGRPGGKGRVAKKNVIKAYTAAHKLKVLQHLDKHGKMAATVATFYPTLGAHQYQSRRVMILFRAVANDANQ